MADSQRPGATAFDGDAFQQSTGQVRAISRKALGHIIGHVECNSHSLALWVLYARVQPKALWLAARTANNSHCKRGRPSRRHKPEITRWSLMSCLPTTITTQPRPNSISRFVGAQEHRAALLHFGILLRRRDCWRRGPIPVGELPTAANELIGRGDEDTLRGEGALSS